MSRVTDGKLRSADGTGKKRILSNGNSVRAWPVNAIKINYTDNIIIISRNANGGITHAEYAEYTNSAGWRGESDINNRCRACVRFGKRIDRGNESYSYFCFIFTNICRLQRP